jgi:hypothetical protein
VTKLHDDAVKGANDKKSSLPNAAANLLHYLDGTGTEMVMGSEVFKKHSATQKALEGEHRGKFVEGGKKRLASGVLKPGGGQVEMTWTGTANAFSMVSKDDLGLAVGGYTLCSKVRVSAQKQGDGSTVMNFDEWQVQAFDCYNWDPGKSVGVLGADDNDLCCLENAKTAMHFRIRTDPWANDDVEASKPADLEAPTPVETGAEEGGGR